MPENMPVVISHDPFARVETVRKIVHTTDGCANCGNNYHGRLFRYGHRRDDNLSGTVALESRAFCGKVCRDQYTA
jgi:hypothetical protein